MKKIKISDVTLRENSFSFKEKIEIVKLLDKLGADVIEVPKIANERTDVLFLHTAAALASNSAVSCPVDLNEKSIDKTVDALKNAKNPIIHIAVPVSTVQMEYMCHKKPPKILEMIKTLVSYAAEKCKRVEFSALDASRSDKEFLAEAIKCAVESGACAVTICDNAGVMLPAEFEELVKYVCVSVPAVKDIEIYCECSDELSLSIASAMSAVGADACGIKTTMSGNYASSLKGVAHIIHTRGDAVGICAGLKYTNLNSLIDNFAKLTGRYTKTADRTSDYSEINLESGDDIEKVSSAAKLLGYDLSEEDIANVYEEFNKVSGKKKIGAKELDAIVASAALQVPPTYKVKSYVINNGNIISATANIILSKGDEELCGVSVGDGPIDSAFRAIEQIIGFHYELDDFQIQAVTEGKEAVGSAVVRLRSEGKLYAGRGVSTDIIGASIYAYINALNKICFEK